MSPETARKILQCMGVSLDKIGEGYPWMTAPCVLAPFLHKKGTDANPSFAINLEHDTFNCFVCSGGTLSSLFQELSFHLSKRPEYADRYDLKTLNSILTGLEVDIVGLPAFVEFEIQQVFQPFPEEWIEGFTPVSQVPRAMDYLNSRQLPPECWQQFDLRYDYAKDMVMAPYRNFSGLLAGARGRAVDPTTPKAYQHHDYRWNKISNAALCWINEQALSSEHPIVVCEGQFDMAQIWRVYDSVVANMTAKVPRRKLEKLATAQAGVCFMLDNDEGGAVGTTKAVEALSKMNPNLPIAVMEFPVQFKDPDEMARQAGIAELRKLMAELGPVKE